ncbi:MAG: arylsulfatase [Opitutaceae bacterium]|nr:arylsulfatase [Opitutaceae bacterium]
MTLRRPLPSFATLLALTTTIAFAAASRPNVILIVTDDQGYGDMACHGNPWLRTPNLDRLHAEGVCLKNYHVDPLCTPTRAALMTGRYSTRVGAWAVTEGRQLLDARETTMGDVFAASGYRTAMFGKWHLGDTFPFAPQYRGFQEVVCHKAGGVGEIGNPPGENYFDPTYFRNGRPEKFSAYCTDIWFDETLRFIGRAAEQKPFFVYLPLNAMHGPHTVAENYSARFLAQGIPEERAKFFGQIENFDENLGRLTTALRERNLERDTIVIFMGDNGTAAGTDGRIPADGFNAGMRGKKGMVYEGGHRVAGLVRWPERLVTGRTVAQLTSLRDWLPTLIALCGLTPPAGVAFDGADITPLLTGAAKDWPERTMFVDRQADRLEQWRPGAKQGATPQFAVLTERWRLVNGELYDIRVDPGQTSNVAAFHPEVALRLHAAYVDWFADVTAHRGAYTRFLLGAGQENPTTFTVRDWHPTVGRVIWEPRHLADDTLFPNGFWAVEITRPGRYEIRLARFPTDAPRLMGANEARLKIGDAEAHLAIAPTDAAANFTLNLPAGPALLTTWLKDASSGRERGAYHVSVRWLGP